ncbi:MAG: ACP S-malonyltransferase [Butyrivibrio sp.]|nr:ACP S-malonyltransferase [Butyrivibrio sp.]
MRAILYAGQGSQHTGMGQDLYEKYPEFREIFDSASLDFDLKKACFENPDNMLLQTKYTQPCMVAFAAGVTRILKNRGIKADYVCGLSLGEYSALEASEVFDTDTAIKTAAFRGEAMTKAAEGIECGMTAVLGLEEKELLLCCEEAKKLGVVSICNYNCPGQLVIGGEKEAVDKCSSLALEHGAKKCIPLAVSGPFHTSLMSPAGNELSDYFKNVTFNPMKTTVLFNFLGRENDQDMSVAELLVYQVQSSVRMEASIRRLFDLGVREFIEVGPGKALSGFVKKTAKDMGISDYSCVSIETADDIENLTCNAQVVA